MTFDPWMSEWGNPIRCCLIDDSREPPELKHLSRERKRKQISDSVSSGERTRNSPNQCACTLGL
jgi:hypothetical protein